MDTTESLEQFQRGNARVEVYASSAAAGRAAAQRAADLIQRAINDKGRARIVVATGNSQVPLVDALIHHQIDWNAVELFHMDEYAGISADHPSSFRFWIRNRIERKVHPGVSHYIAGDAADLDAEMNRYADLLKERPIEVAFVGFGENGHIAFNDPSVADFEDPFTVKRVTLDEACRRQQAGEGHFPDVESVPKEAATITCPGLLVAQAWICCVPEKRKAAAVRDALEGPASETCPASLVRRHPAAQVFLDRESASLLSGQELGRR